MTSRILYVDDDSESREMLKALLSMADSEYHIATAASAEEALELIDDAPFDLYLFDYMLPNMDGLTLCRTIRDRGLHEPIIVFTGMVRPDDKRHVLAAGANEYLVKPNDLDMVAATVRRLLNRNSAHTTQ
jgi:two-component system, OmpR family, response regulator MtrA